MGRASARADGSHDGVTAAIDRLLGEGARNAERSRRLHRRLGLAALSRLDAVALEREGGLTARQAQRLEAAFLLGRSVERARQVRAQPMRSPAQIVRLLAPDLRGLDKETFHVLVLDTRHRLIGREQVSVGTLTTSLVHPREVFRAAILLGGASIVVVHNHPSGDPEPSAEDEAVTRRLGEAGRLLGIPLLDHVVVGDGAWVSLRQGRDGWFDAS